MSDTDEHYGQLGGHCPARRKAIAAQIESDVEAQIIGDGFTHGPSTHDDHAHYAAPDHAIGIGGM